MANPWFRLYSEFSHDPKVQMLSEAMQRRYVMIMCMRCSNGLVTLHEAEIAFHLRISNEDLAETKAVFIAKGFIDCDWNLLNWEKRQFSSDSSAPRVARHRAKQKEACNGDVTLQVQKCNVLDTDTDTDTDKNKEVKKRSQKKVNTEKTLSEFLEDCKTSGEKAIREDDPIFEWAKTVSLPSDMLHLGWTEFKNIQAADKKQADWRATFRNYVKKDYLKVWALNREGEYYLTLRGKQLERELNGAPA